MLTEQGRLRAFLWDPRTETAIGLPGLADGATAAHDVDNALHVVGTARAANGQFAAVLWTLGH